ncbi:MAG: phage holin family protein [Sulfuricella sp.]|nr:phage holin family protein [Sulfuricella sp.]
MAAEAKNQGARSPGGLFDSMKALACTLISIAHTRMELFSTELEEERMHLYSMLVWAVVALFFAGFGIVLATLFVVLVLWDTHRLLALGVPAFLFLLGAVLAWRVVLDKARAKPRLFAASLAELSRDREHLASRS